MSTHSRRKPQRPEPTDCGRRNFLKALGAAAAAAAVSGETAAGDDSAQAKPESQGYHETQHIRDYYASARI